MGMIQPSQNPELTPETGQGSLGFLVKEEVQQFYRHLSLFDQIGGPVHGTHTTPAQELLNLVASIDSLINQDLLPRSVSVSPVEIIY
jgi:hypothetical protein